jgi:methylenetetrahydrofolate reductase (NADPH)
MDNGFIENAHLSLSKPQKDIEVSFEFFPPASEAMAVQLWQAIETLAPLQPEFVSVTYGAGGSTRERTHSTVMRVLQETQLKPAAHLTCVDSSYEDIASIAHAYWEAGVRALVALRGDSPLGDAAMHNPHGYNSGIELVAGLRKLHDFDIAVAAYPEIHPKAESAQVDLDVLKAKQDAGATKAITQFFFEADTFLRFRDKAQAAGITLPIIPGILPVTNLAQAQRFAQQCGIYFPETLAKQLANLEAHPVTRQLVAATQSAQLVDRLRSGGVEHFHFYTLNRPELSYAICHILGIHAQETI